MPSPLKRVELDFLFLGEIGTLPSYRHRLSPTPKELEASLEALGILTPLLLRHDHVLLSGYRRLDFAQKKGIAKLPVRLLPKLSRAELLRIAVREQAITSPLSPLEKISLFVAVAEDCRDEERIDLLPEIGFPKDAKLPSLFRQVLDLSQELKVLLHQKRCSFYALVPFLHLDPPSQEILASWLEQKRLTLSLFQELSRLLYEVSLLEGKSPQEVLNEEEKRPSGAQRVGTLRQSLRARRYPQTEARRRRCEQALAKLSPPTFFHWEVPLPGEEVQVRGTLSSSRELELLIEWFMREKRELIKFFQKVEEGEEF